MDTFSIIRDAVARATSDPDKAGLSAADREAGDVIAAVQVVVDVLTPPGGGRYIVGFADIATAATSLNEHRIIVSSKPLRDYRLSTVEKAVVIATFAAHEIGHTFVTAPRKDMVAVHNPKSGYHAVANLADDIVLEPFMVARYPILEDAFAFTGAWVLRTTAGELPKVVKMRRDMKTAERFNAVLSATRYDDSAPIVWDGDAAARERDWCRDWAARLIAAPTVDHATFFALCDELWDRIRCEAEEDPEPEPPIIDEPVGPPGPKRDEDEDEDEDEDGEDEPTGESKDPNDAPRDFDDEDDEDDGEGESKDGDEDGNEGGDEPTDEPADEPTDEPTDGKDEGDEPTDEPTGPSDPKDGDDEPDDESSKDDLDKEPEASSDDDEGGPNSSPARGEDDFDERDIDKSTHDQVKRPEYDSRADDYERAVREYASTTATTFGRHGTLSTRWD
jgi:hypothetical protein